MLSLPPREPMSAIDLAWLRMERPTNPMTIVGVLTLASRVRFEDIRALIESRLLSFARFRSLPQPGLTDTHWEADPNFDLDAHLQRLVLPPGAKRPALEAAVSELASNALDPHHPLWQIHVVERYRHGSAVIARFHHCYADGMALLRVMESLTDNVQPSIRSSGDATSATAGWLSHLPLFGPAWSLIQQLGGGVLDAASTSLHALAHPQETTALAQQAAGAVAELARIATLREDPATPLRRPLSTRKHVAWTEPLPLDEIKTIAHVLDCTVNDVLLSTVAGAFGRHLRQQGFDTNGVAIRGLVPVNMRSAAAEPVLGNRFGLVFANLPLGELNPVARVIAVHEDMERLKSSSQPLMSLWLLASLGLLPTAIEEQAIDLFTTKATVVISNVPGVQHPLRLADTRIDQQLFWVPQAGHIGVGVSLFTYDGSLTFGVMADRNVLPDPAELVDAFTTELEELLLCVISLAAVLDDAKSP